LGRRIGDKGDATLLHSILLSYFLFSGCASTLVRRQNPHAHIKILDYKKASTSARQLSPSSLHVGPASRLHLAKIAYSSMTGNEFGSGGIKGRPELHIPIV
jgi:hypothetical protein